MPLLADFRPPVRRALPWLVGFRFVGNVGVRFVYSFLAPISRGSGLSIEQLGQVLAVRDLTGLAAPGVGRAADRRGTGRTMTVAAVVMVVGLLLASIGQLGLIIGLVLFGLGKIAYDVPMNAWIGNEIAYERRGKALGIVELSWAAAALIGMPICGLLIENVGWWSASAFFGLLGIPLALGVATHVGSDHHEETGAKVRLTFGSNAIFVLVSFCTLTLCSQLLLVGHGLWLEDTYDFDPSQVGFAVITIGVIEAIASSSSTAFTDGLGKRRSMIMGIGLLAVAMAILAIVSAPPLVLGLVLLATAFLGFEFAFVSSLPLVTELDPAARAQMIGFALGLSTVVRAVMSVVGTWLYVRQGFDALMLLGAGAAVIGLAVLLLFVVEPEALPPVTPPDQRELLN